MLHSRHFIDQIQAGQPLDRADGHIILTAKGAAFTDILAGAHCLKEHAFGETIFLCSIINAKSGRCAENCAFCAQSSHFQTSTPTYPLKDRQEIVAAAQTAALQGSTCFSIVTSGTSPKPGKEFESLLDALKEIRDTTSIEPSASLGILNEAKAAALADAGCVTYHHNLETARSFFPKVCTTHDYEEDVNTIKLTKQHGMRACCGGILGLGESLDQRIELAETLRELNVDSVPLNLLNPISGTPLAGVQNLTPLDCLRAVALFRYFLPEKRISVCGGRETNLRELQSWIIMAGASGIMVGNYLTTSGRELQTDMQLFKDLETKINGC